MRSARAKRRQRQANRRQWAIYGVLARNGPLTQTSICLELDCSLGTLYPDLATIERKGLITGIWAEEPAPRHRLWRAET